MNYKNKIRILIVDDNEQLRKSFSSRLRRLSQKSGIDVSFLYAECTKEAVSACESQLVDYAIVDMLLNKSMEEHAHESDNGCKVAEALKETHPEMKCCGFTAYMGNKVLKQAKNSKLFSEIFPKPIDYNLLIPHIIREAFGE